jgi:hypothetical protein
LLLVNAGIQEEEGVMRQEIVSMLGFVLVAGCAASTPGARPHDMSQAAHSEQAAAESTEADEHAGQYDADAKAKAEECRARLRTDTPTTGGQVCWTAVTNPTEEHLRVAAEHRKHAEAHRAASTALRDTEARACAGIDPDDRDISPFDRVEDIASVSPLTEETGTVKTPRPRTAGAVVIFRAVPGLTAEWLQREVDCHLARNASLGHVAEAMPNCPLVPKGASAKVESTGSGFKVTVRSDDDASAKEILERATRLKTNR